MPTPGVAPFNPAGGTPLASTSPFPHKNVLSGAMVGTQQSSTSVFSRMATDTSTQQSNSTGGTRRATRLSVKNALSKFKNTEDDPVDLDD